MQERSRGTRLDKKARIKESLRAEWHRMLERRGIPEETESAQRVLASYYLSGEGTNRSRCPSGRGCDWCSQNRTCSVRRALQSLEDEMELWREGDSE